MRTNHLRSTASNALIFVAALVILNALVDRRRACSCGADCWCRAWPGRHLRWLIPGTFHTG